MLPERFCNAQQLQSVVVWCRTGQITPGYYTSSLQADRVLLHPKTPLLFMVKMVHSFPAQGFKVFFWHRASKLHL